MRSQTAYTLEKLNKELADAEIEQEATNEAFATAQRESHTS